MQLPTSAVRTSFNSPLGVLHVLAADAHLIGIWFDQQAHQPNLQAVARAPDHAVLQLTTVQLRAYFAGQRQGFDLPLRLAFGTAFQQAVWLTLQTLQYGQTCSYKEISVRLGRPQAMRAVGAAVGRNPLSIVVPCHRVVGANGQLTGYAGGLERKAALLLLERRA